MIKIGESVQRIFLQFRLGDHNLLPRWGEPLLDRRERPEGGSGGELKIEPTACVSLRGFVHELNALGFQLSSLFCGERGDDPKPYYVARFIFVRSREKTEARAEVREDLRRLCEDSLWQVRAYVNPIRLKGGEESGQTEVSVNLDSRLPLIGSDGNPVLVWQREGKKRLLDQPKVPLAPVLYLSAEDRLIELTKFDPARRAADRKEEERQEKLGEYNGSAVKTTLDAVEADKERRRNLLRADLRIVNDLLSKIPGGFKLPEGTREKILSVEEGVDAMTMAADTYEVGRELIAELHGVVAKVAAKAANWRRHANPVVPKRKDFSGREAY